MPASVSALGKALAMTPPVRILARALTEAICSRDTLALSEATSKNTSIFDGTSCATLWTSAGGIGANSTETIVARSFHIWLKRKSRSLVGIESRVPTTVRFQQPSHAVAKVGAIDSNLPSWSAAITKRPRIDRWGLHRSWAYAATASDNVRPAGGNVPA